MWRFTWNRAIHRQVPILWRDSSMRANSRWRATRWKSHAKCGGHGVNSVSFGSADEIDAQLLSTFLRERDVECPLCAYNLRNLRETRCPECGNELKLSVQLTEPRIFWPVAGLIGLSVGFGFSLFFLVYCLIRFGIIQGRFPSDLLAKLLPYAVVPVLVQGFAVGVWSWRWYAVRQLPPRRRIALVVGAWLVSLLNIVLFSLNVR